MPSSLIPFNVNRSSQDAGSLTGSGVVVVVVFVCGGVGKGKLPIPPF